MDDCERLRRTKWECKYHVVFIPKGRRKKLYKQLRQHLGEVFRRLAPLSLSTMRGEPVVPYLLVIAGRSICGDGPRAKGGVGWGQASL